VVNRAERISRRDALNRLLLSILLAVGLWAWVTSSRDPDRTRTFANVPVTPVNVPPELVMVGELPTVEARFRASRSVTEDLVSTDAVATVDFSEVSGPGSYTLPVRLERPDGVWSVSASPASVPVVVEEQQSKALHLEVRASGNLGMNQQVGRVTPSASEVVVTGPRSVVERAVHALLPIDIANRTDDFTGAFTPVVVDGNGLPVTGVMINPGTITATVEITARGKQVAVVAQVTGTPAPGFEIVDRTLNPDTVLIDGPPDVIDALLTVNTEPVDVSGADGDVAKRVAIGDLPPGVTLIEPASGQVDVVVQIRQCGVQQPLPSQSVMVVNLAPGLRAEVAPETVLVTVIASEQELAELSPDSLSVIVDVAGRGPGTYVLPPRVVVPPNVEWLSVEPTTVTVVISDGVVPVGSPAATPVSAP
jgi:YbbR domain-containing protein